MPSHPSPAWGSPVKKFLTELVDDLITEYWLPAVGIGALVILGSIAGLIWSATMESPESVSLFGQPVSGESVRSGSQTIGGRIVGAFSPQAQAAQEQCTEGSVKGFLKLAGLILLPVGILWTAAWAYGAAKYESESAPA